MKKELGHFRVDDCYGSCQDWFTDWWMKVGGCGAITACDSCVYLKRYKGLDRLYPFSPVAMVKSDYVRFAMEMKPFLRPRWHGIDKLYLYRQGFEAYLKRAGETRLTMEELPGTAPFAQAAAALTEQIDAGLPVPCLTLKHTNAEFADYVWHWYLLNGYEKTEDGRLLVRAVTYGKPRWLDFEGLWNTGCEPKGGLILYRLAET